MFLDSQSFCPQGSMTVPSCTENTKWIINKQKLPISEYQLNKFRNLKTNDFDTDYLRYVSMIKFKMQSFSQHIFVCRDNFRPTQSLNDRKIYSRTEENVLPPFGLDERAVTVLGTSLVSVGTFGLMQNLLSNFDIRRTFSENPLLEMIKRISLSIFKNLPFVEIF